MNAASNWISRAAMHGLPMAQYQMAVLLFKDEGIPKDEAESM
jgi:TPR repeat protein